MPVYWYRSCSACDKVRITWEILHGDRNELESDKCHCKNSHSMHHHVVVQHGVMVVFNERQEV